MRELEAAVTQVEQRLGAPLPGEYRLWLFQHRSIPTDHRQSPFEVIELLETQRLVQDVLPPGHLAIGPDGYGNLVLLRLCDGSVEWWSPDHEPSDRRTDTIAASFSNYLELISSGQV